MKRVLLIVHPTRPAAAKFANDLSSRFVAQGYEILSNYPALIDSARAIDEVHNSDWAIVLGGDGTILRAAEIVRGHKVPIIGINLGNVGFLAEISQPTIDEIVNSVVNSQIHVEPRILLKYEVSRAEKLVSTSWALNEISIERNSTQMLELFVQIDGRPLSKWGCDGVICATPTGSTAYAFSAGGPVVWPEVNALVLLPLAAHALFSRPMVISPDCEIVIDVRSSAAQIAADGLRHFELQEHDRIVITKDANLVDLAYINPGNFTDRLVAKFKLPIEGWRGESL